MVVEYEDDTIAAVSTPPGEGGIGIVRMSGDASLSIALEIFAHSRLRGKKDFFQKMESLHPRNLYYGYIVDEAGNELDEVLLSYMKAPYTYTSEDVVEINAHGGIVPLQKILHLVLRKGARLAEPGEFTKRAFLNGKIDLVQAESVLSLIRAKTEKGLKAALQSLHGSLSKEIKQMREELLSIISQIEVEVDFSEEDLDLEEAVYRNIKEKLMLIKERLEILLEKRNQGKILQDGLKTVIVGRPNVGKSSLYNYLIREERAIVTEIPGTTRDLLVEFVNLNGIPLKLIDTAGFRENGDRVEKIGMEFSKRAMREADLLLFMLDAETGITQKDRWIYDSIFDEGNNPKLIVIINKVDLTQKITTDEIKRLFSADRIVEISLLEGTGLQELEDTVTDAVFKGNVTRDEGVIVLEARQGNLISKAAQNITEALDALEGKIPPDIVSIDIKQAWKHLSELLGEDIKDEVLDYIFSRFCIGK
ncbi:MAG: tRNA uridine-5-carboxymethylaminomethyl(34) synthesis GTPase MnmE [Bacillota bacterium]|nr:tRNA uridine-5-carboxymethylaminomethyl(34) synthesis GTPase MnmE [Bacillota bacterium]